MKRIVKICSIIILSVICFIILAILSIIIFKDEIIKYISESENNEVITYYTSDIPVEQEYFAEDFESIHRQIIDNSSIYKLKEYNIDSLYNSFALRINKSDMTKKEYALLVVEYLAALNIGHSSASINPYSLGQRLEVIENRLFIDNPNEYLKNCGLQDKDEIIGINQMTIDEYVDHQKKYVSSSTEAARIFLTRRWVFINSYTDSVLLCDILRNGKYLNIKVPLKAQNTTKSKNHPQATYKILNNHVGYIDITSMMGNVVEDFTKAYNEVHNMPYLIIDIRNNSGDNSNNGRLIAEYLLNNEQQHCIGGNITPKENAYKGKLFLLTSPYTFSAAESFALDLKESEQVILIGETTSGDTGCNPKNFISKYGIWFRVPTKERGFSPKGFPLEGTGIQPHIEVKQTIKDFLDDKDSVIEYILNNLI